MSPRRGRIGRGADEPEGESPGVTPSEDHPAPEPLAEPLSRRAAEPPSSEPPPADAPAAEPPRRRAATLRLAGLYTLGLVVIFGLGWLGSAFFFSPAPLLPEERTVPVVLGRPLAEARQAIESVDLRVRADERRPHPTAAAGTVLWQDPAPGTVVPLNTPVLVVTSSGRPTIAVPDLAGIGVAQARLILEAAGLTVGEIDTVAAQVEADVVLGTRPSAGNARTAGATVALIVSGPGLRTQPAWTPGGRPPAEVDSVPPLGPLDEEWR